MRFAFFRGYICTANEDGSIPLNSQVVCFVGEYGLSKSLNTELLELMLQLANRPETETKP